MSDSSLGCFSIFLSLNCRLLSSCVFRPILAVFIGICQSRQRRLIAPWSITHIQPIGSCKRQSISVTSPSLAVLWRKHCIVEKHCQYQRLQITSNMVCRWCLYWGISFDVANYVLKFRNDTVTPLKCWLTKINYKQHVFSLSLSCLGFEITVLK